MIKAIIIISLKELNVVLFFSLLNGSESLLRIAAERLPIYFGIKWMGYIFSSYNFSTNAKLFL